MINLINHEIIKVFKAYVDNPNLILFGITGDIDDLGMYVANHGRPKAENLVELWNLIIKDYLRSWKSSNVNKLSDLYVETSGEEVMVLGLAKDIQIIDQLFQNIEEDINSRVKENGIIDWEDTSISFGSKIFSGELFKESISLLLDCMPFDDISQVKQYYRVLELIRHELSRNLDLSKFKHLLNGKLEHSVLYRNYSLYKLYDYKQSTKTYLCRLSNYLDNGNKLKVDESLYNIYGLKQVNTVNLNDLDRSILKVKIK